MSYQMKDGVTQGVRPQVGPSDLRDAQRALRNEERDDEANFFSDAASALQREIAIVFDSGAYELSVWSTVLCRYDTIDGEDFTLALRVPVFNAKEMLPFLRRSGFIVEHHVFGVSLND